jgi:hypothetical protein
LVGAGWVLIASLLEGFTEIKFSIWDGTIRIGMLTHHIYHKGLVGKVSKELKLQKCKEKTGERRG